MVATEVFKQVKEEISQVVDHDTRFIPEMKIGQKVRQGDIYLTKVADNHPKGGIVENRQLATGTSKGSRHIAGEGFMVFRGTTLPAGFLDGTFLGPCIQTEERALIQHPEHAWYSLPAGTYQVTHQTDLRTRQRAKD